MKLCLHPARFNTSHLTAIATAVVIVLAGAPGFATTLQPEPKPKKPKVVDDRNERIEKMTAKLYDVTTPRNPLNKIDDLTKDRVIERLRELSGVHAGTTSLSHKDSKDSKKEVVAPEECTWFCNPSVFAEYYWLNSNDKTGADFDGQTNSVSVGFDFTTIGDLLVGLIYSYTYSDLDSDSLRGGSQSDSNFINIYVAKSVTNWLSVGVSGGYGHTDSVVTVSRPFRETISDSDTWNASPFVTLSYASGNFFANFTTTYLYAHADSRDTGKVSFDLQTGYAFTEWLTISDHAKFTQIVHSESDSGQDDNWWTFGAKFTVHATRSLDLYAGYDFEFNNDYEDHMVTAGLTFLF